MPPPADWAQHDCSAKISSSSKPFMRWRCRVRDNFYEETEMGKLEIISMALQLKAAERYEIVEQIMQSLDKSDTEIDRVWAEEAVRRVKACTDGRMALIPFDEIFGKE